MLPMISTFKLDFAPKNIFTKNLNTFDASRIKLLISTKCEAADDGTDDSIYYYDDDDDGPVSTWRCYRYMSALLCRNTSISIGLHCIKIPKNVQLSFYLSLLLNVFITRNHTNTPGRRQSKTPILSRNVDQISIETVFSIAICRHTGDKWESKKLFLSILICVRRLLIRFRLPPTRCD